MLILGVAAESNESHHPSTAVQEGPETRADAGLLLQLTAAAATPVYNYK